MVFKTRRVHVCKEGRALFAAAGRIYTVVWEGVYGSGGPVPSLLRGIPETRGDPLVVRHASALLSRVPPMNPRDTLVQAG